MHLILCGLPCSGKTTIGTLLSGILKRPFIDTDLMIETAYALQSRSSLSCRQIYEKEGGPFFRALEKSQVLSLNVAPPTILALGGGTLDDPESLAHLKRFGILVYLDVPLDILWERILLHKGIPAFLKEQSPRESFYALAQKRIPLYESSASLRVHVGTSDEKTVAESILSLSKRFF